MKKIIDGIPQWVEQYNSEDQNTRRRMGANKKRNRPNFIALTSEYFNGGAGDTTTLYNVAKFIEKLYDEWVRP